MKRKYNMVDVTVIDVEKFIDKENRERRRVTCQLSTGDVVQVSENGPLMLNGTSFGAHSQVSVHLRNALLMILETVSIA